MAIPAPAPTSTCLVTGASSGIGAEIAGLLAARGHGVTLVARRRERLEAVAGELAGRHGVRAEVITCDLADADARTALVGGLDERRLVVDVLVNNAGFGTAGPVAAADRRRELELVRTDVEAVVDLCTLLVGGMVARGRGAVLNVASTAAYQPIPGQAAYAAAKAFVLSYTEALRAEVRRKGVTVTALCPGPVATEFNQVAGVSDDEAAAALPRVLWVSAAAVARAAVDGLERDRAVVVPGLANRLGAVAGHLAPHSVVLPLLAGRHPALRRPGPAGGGR
ncbi:MAG: SDR family NAD(P)-dependent oxidoreductase [Acidimicrobiales bacterium]